jgi:superfamily II DNA helicase RecQ
LRLRQLLQSELRITFSTGGIEGIPIVGLTATATLPVQEQICETLGMGKCESVVVRSGELTRSNCDVSKHVFICENNEDRERKLLELLATEENFCGPNLVIIYVPFKHVATSVAKILAQHKIKYVFLFVVL